MFLCWQWKSLWKVRNEAAIVQFSSLCLNAFTDGFWRVENMLTNILYYQELNQQTNKDHSMQKKKFETIVGITNKPRQYWCFCQSSLFPKPLVCRIQNTTTTINKQWRCNCKHLLSKIQQQTNRMWLAWNGLEGKYRGRGGLTQNPIRKWERSKLDKIRIPSILMLFKWPQKNTWNNYIVM